MATYTIGAGKTYANLGAFVTAYNAGSLTGAVVAEVYGTTSESANVVFSPGAGVTSLVVRAAPGQENEGVIGAGARVEMGFAGSAGYNIQLQKSGSSTLTSIVFEDVEFRGSTKSQQLFTCSEADGPLVVRRCIFINRATSGGTSVLVNFEMGPGLGGPLDYLSFSNNLILNPSGDGVTGVTGLSVEDLFSASGTETWLIDNNTVYGYPHLGIVVAANVAGCTLRVRNNIVMGSTGLGDDYNQLGVTTFSSNLSSDATGTITNKLASNQFTDSALTIAAADLSLKTGADAIDVGGNLGTTNDVNLDIAQYDRTAGTWDLGAGELSSGPVAITKSFADGIKAEESLLKNTNNIFDDLVYSGTIEDTIIYSGTVEDLGSLGSLEEQQVYSGLIEEI